ncbi:exodeoxyribonuclease III [Aciduliprofundum sp. MAR08-339]|uniref:exodeoxyribonuclease III n=1 Tax=Aciduliprofundum sp. (strain MAR08-339) TaxID=673860 RepID=UPI00064E3583
MELLLMSWNVNGIRAAVRNGFLKFLEKYNPDILALQEIKAREDDIPLEVRYYEGYRKFFNPARRKGYAGTALFTKIEPESVSFGIGDERFDSEGRVITAEYERFYLVNAYFPNSQHGLTRLDFKIEFDRKIHAYLNELRRSKPVVLCGDFNVAHKEIDLANPKQNEKNAGFTPEERAWMDEFLNDGYVDTFRMFTKEGGHYTWWTYRFNARARNIGWRVDYFVVSKDLVPHVKKSWIMSDVYGSDHAPIAMILEI